MPDGEIKTVADSRAQREFVASTPALKNSERTLSNIHKMITEEAWDLQAGKNRRIGKKRRGPGKKEVNGIGKKTSKIDVISLPQEFLETYFVVETT